MYFHASALIFGTIVTIFALRNYSFFSWHPICMSIGFSVLMIESVALMSAKFEIFDKDKSGKNLKVNLHGYLSFIALLFASYGFYVVYSNKNANQKAHFTSWHGLSGLTLTISAVCQLCAGLIIKYAVSLKIGHFIALKNLKFYHTLSGCSILLASGAVSLGGLRSNWFLKTVGSSYAGLAAEVCLAAMALYGLSLLKKVTSKRMKKMRADDVVEIEKIKS